MASFRLKKKKEKKKVLNQFSVATGKKTTKKYSNSLYNSVVKDTVKKYNKQQDRNRKAREKRELKKSKIEKAGLTGLISPNTPDKDWEKAWKKAVNIKRQEEKRNYLISIGVKPEHINSKLLNSSWEKINSITPEKNPELFGIKKLSKVYEVEDFLMVAFHDTSYDLNFEDVWMYYKDWNEKELKREIKNIISLEIHDNPDDSDGYSGDIQVNSGTYSEMLSMKKYYKITKYSTVFSNKWTLRGALSLTACALNYSTENNRRIVYRDIKAYFIKNIKDIGKEL